MRYGEERLIVDSFTSKGTKEIDFSDINEEELHLYYEFILNGKVVSEGSQLFTVNKYYNFVNPELTCVLNGQEIIITSSAYARGVEIEGIDGDVILSDNYFDMEKGEKKIFILEGNAKKFSLRSVYDIK